jgi:hypothetical protein
LCWCQLWVCFRRESPWASSGNSGDSRCHNTIPEGGDLQGICPPGGVRVGLGVSGGAGSLCDQPSDRVRER